MTYVPQLFAGYANARTEDEKVPYLFGDRTLIAIDAALAAKRPLLVAGPPGSGKSTLARAIATGLDARYLARTITSRTRVDDLFAELDALERLADAQTARTRGELNPTWTYLRPGVLWWAFDRDGARLRGATDSDRALLGARCPPPLDAAQDPTEGNGSGSDAVVLLDEIDKADPDLPNDLLEPLDRNSFALPVPNRPKVEKRTPGRVVIVLTTNGERELPRAFVRRCVTLILDEPRSRAKSADGATALEDIAAAHFGPADEQEKQLFERIAEDVEALRDEARRSGERPPSAAEYLDAVRAVREVPSLHRQEVRQQVRLLLLRKPSAPGA